MNTYEEKINLLSEMIAFSAVDGKLHTREYDFLSIVAAELKIKKEDFKNLFHQELPSINIRSEAQRIQQFYRLALLMHIDGVLHVREITAIHQIGIDMGLNPSATRRVLKAMNEAPNAILNPQKVLQIFSEQHN